ncbi:MAG: cobalamin biosynthesis protein [Spirochaetota bacterium]
MNPEQRKNRMKPEQDAHGNAPEHAGQPVLNPGDTKQAVPPEERIRRMETPGQVALVTLSGQGLETALRIRNSWQGGTGRPPERDKLPLYAPAGVLREAPDLEQAAPRTLLPFDQGIAELAGTLFQQYAGLVFVMPLGVVIRAAAAHIRSKYTDPAVVTVDVTGRWVISTLSGHEGGANRLAELTAAALNTGAVVTTSTEAARSIVLGVGCRKGVSSAQVEEALHRALELAGARLEEVRLIATAENKRAEPGLTEFCARSGILLRSVSLHHIAHSRLGYRRSRLVERTLGVGGVAVPCAILGGIKTQLIQEKVRWNNVTVAVARERSDW